MKKRGGKMKKIVHIIRKKNIATKLKLKIYVEKIIVRSKRKTLDIVLVASVTFDPFIR